MPEINIEEDMQYDVIRAGFWSGGDKNIFKKYKSCRNLLILVGILSLCSFWLLIGMAINIKFGSCRP